MSKITITSTVKNVGDDTVQVILTIPKASGADESWTFGANGLTIQKWGRVNWQYVIDDPLMVPGIYSMTINDADMRLKGILYGPNINFSIGNYPSVELKINGVSKYNGLVQEQSGMVWNAGVRTVDFIFTPGTMALNTTRIYAKDCDTEPAAIRSAVKDGDSVIVTTDFLVSTHIPRYVVGTMITIKEVEGMTDINGRFKISGIFYTADNLPDKTKFRIDVSTTQTYSAGGTATQSVCYNPFNYELDDYIGVKQILGDIFRLVNPSLTDNQVQIFHDWIFKGYKYHSAPFYPVEDIVFEELAFWINSLYFNSTNGVVNVADILKKLALDFCSFAGMVDKNTPFFKKLFHYNASNTQTLKLVKDRKFNYKYSLIESANASIALWWNASYVYAKGKESGIDERNLQRDIFTGFYYSADNAWQTVVNANIDRGSGDELYYVIRGKDPVLLSGAWADMGSLITEFWYKYRGNILNCREDLIIAEGIGYDYLKDFPDDGRKYQPIGLTLDLDAGESEFDAIYCGEV